MMQKEICGWIGTCFASCMSFFVQREEPEVQNYQF